MPGGYYDPATPGHCVLNQEEFLKAFGGTLSGAIGCWCHYLGTEEVREVVWRLSSRWRESKGPQHYPRPFRWSFEDLNKACETAIGSLCEGWEMVLGRAAVARELADQYEDADQWKLRQQIALTFAAKFIEIDKQEAAGEKETN
jgi:hypothetical protein